MGNSMGGKSSKTTVDIPDPSPAELRNQALFGAMLEAQLRDQGWKIQETRTPTGGGGGSGGSGIPHRVVNGGVMVGDTFYKEGTQAYKNITTSASTGGSSTAGGTSISLTKDPVVAAREARRENRLEQAEQSLFSAIQKTLKGDFSVSTRQRRQIDSIISGSGLTDFSSFNRMKGELQRGINQATNRVGAATDEMVNEQMGLADTAVSELQVLFASSEAAVTSAVDRLVNAGNLKVAEEMTLFRRELDNTAARLGRSSADAVFTTEASRATVGAFERLYAQGSAAAAQGIAGLRQQLGAQVAGIRQEEAGNIAALRGQELGTVSSLAGMGVQGLSNIQGLEAQQRNTASMARLNLLGQAAQPYQALAGGGSFVQLQNALNQQGLANLASTSSQLSNRLGQQLQERAAQPTTTTYQPFDWGALVGGIAGIGAAGIRSFI